jgi:hypothetical protein
MVNIFTNISKSNNHLSPQIIQHKKDNDIYGVGNQGSGLGQTQKYGEG